MPYTATFQSVASVDGETFTQSVTKTTAGREGVSASIPAAKVGQLTTRTDNDTGTVTMATGHGFATSDKIDLFWSGGSRRAMTATVTGDSVVLDGGSGDNLPANLTNITAMKPVEYDFSIDGDALELLAIKSPAQGWIVFVDDAPADVAAATYRFDASGGQSWVEETGTTNPLAGTITTKVKFSHASSAGAQTMRAEARLTAA